MKKIKQFLTATPTPIEDILFGMILGFAIFNGLGALVMFLDNL